MRDALLDQHRVDWTAARRLLDGAVADGRPDSMRRIRLLVEVIRGMQVGEREAFGLDVAFFQFDSMTEEHLEAFVAGKWPRKSR
jgi:hypothetical protein